MCFFLAFTQSCCVFLKIRPPTFSTQSFARKRIGTIARTSRTKSIPLRDLLARFWDESVRRGRSNAIKFNPETGTTVHQELLLVVPLLQTLRLSPAPCCASAAVINNNKVPTVMRELPLALPLRPWGIMACIHRCRNATRSALHESGDTPPLTTLRHLLSTPQISLCRPVVRFPPNAAFFEAVFW